VRIRFLADANVDPDVGLGLIRRASEIDYRPALGIIPDGMTDPEVLAVADDRVLVTKDIRTMPRHFADFIVNRDSPGIVLIPRGTPIALCIEGLFLAWLSWPAESMRNQMRWLPK
jgi:hypothetical protein